jgi:hypothetical protein
MFLEIVFSILDKNVSSIKAIKQIKITLKKFSNRGRI